MIKKDWKERLGEKIWLGLLEGKGVMGGDGKEEGKMGNGKEKKKKVLKKKKGIKKHRKKAKWKERLGKKIWLGLNTNK